MTKNKNKLFIIGIIILFIISLIISFIIALKNTKTDRTKSNDLKNTNSTENITKGGTYKLTGNNSCVNINTTEKVELELSDATITCSNGPAINVEEAGELTIIITGENTISATTTEELDGAIYSKDDIVLSGDGSLSITSNYDGIVSKYSLTINSGTYTIKTDDDAIRGKDNVVITNGVFNITANGDGIKATNEDEKGYINISGGTFNIEASDDGINSTGDIKIDNGKFTINSKGDGIHADGLVEINDGQYSITSAEGIEGTYVKMNGGDINISASDDGINATNKSTDYDVIVEINGGNLTIKMGQGDTDAIDSNGNLYINGGTINITAQSAFDYDKEAKYNGGTVTVNGEKITTITNQMMGGPGGMQQGNNFGGNRPSRMR